jgi:FHA domain-containing protein
MFTEHTLERNRPNAAPPKPPTGRDIWNAVQAELILNLYPLPFTTLAPTIYHVYLHPDDFDVIEPVAGRIVSQIERGLAAEVDRTNRRIERSGRRVLSRLLHRDQPRPIEGPAAGWEVYIKPDRNGEIAPGHLGIVSALAMPAPVEYGGTPTTRIVRSVVGQGRRTSTISEVAQNPAEAIDAPARSAQASDAGDRAKLRYEDDRGPHEFVMKKDTLSVGRGGSSAWVDVQVSASSKVSREHFRIRRDPGGRFFIQDVSLWGTFVDGKPVPPALKTPDGVVQPGPEHPLSARSRIGLADALTIEFEAIDGA